jgi:glycosyltransferase involved in cell wall biosynthesis
MIRRFGNIDPAKAHNTRSLGRNLQTRLSSKAQRMISPKSYRIVILSLISVFEQNGEFYTLDLWARDLEVQANFAQVDLICPFKKPNGTEQAKKKLEPRIRVHEYEKLDDNALDVIISAADVVQIPGGLTWKQSASARRLLKAGQRNGKIVILGVSSNRARTARLNSSGKGLIRSLKGLFDYFDIRISQSWLALQVDGVHVVGNGVAQLFRHVNRTVHIGTASWIRASDIVCKVPDEPSHPLRLCIASRLEQMKGVHIGIAAVANLVREHRLELRLTIIGEGPEKTNLQQQVAASGLATITDFLTPLAYPQPFLDLLASMDIVLLTNLNDEQPRLMFDAISRGCFPLCPDTPSYHGFGFDARLFYQQGNAQSLARAIAVLCDSTIREELRAKLPDIARTFTIEAMHEKRAAWINSLLDIRRSY